MDKDQKSDKLFEILNIGKSVSNKKNGMINLSTPFDFTKSNKENDRTIKFENISQAIEIISEFAGKENSEKIKKQITDSFTNSLEFEKPFILEFKVID